MPNPRKSRSEEPVQRERRLRSLLANRGELKFTSVDVKTYHSSPRSSEKTSSKPREPLFKSKGIAKNDEESYKKDPAADSDKDNKKTAELHGMRHLKAVLKEQLAINSKRRVDTSQKQMESKATPRGTSISPVNRQAQGRFAFLKNIKPSKLDYALKYAKPAETSSPNAELTDTQPNKALHMRETQWRRETKSKFFDTGSSQSGSKNVDLDKIVKSVSRSGHRLRDPFRLVSLLITSCSVFLFLVLAMCASIQIAVMISLLPFMDKMIETFLRKIFGRGLRKETEDESASRDFLEKLICEVEARTKAQIGKRLIMDVPHGKS